MALTNHQRKHVLALLSDADDVKDFATGNRMRDEAAKLLDGRLTWPVDLIRPYEIHDWSEKRFDVGNP